MSYTNADLVKRQVSAPIATGGVVKTQDVTLTGQTWQNLTTGAIDANSVRLTARTKTAPTSETLSFVTNDIVLSASPSASDGIVVANNSSLSVIYEEGVDYLVDYGAAKVKRLTGGAIAINDAVVVWYFALTTFTEGVDYDVDNANGLIRRVTGGGIVDGLRVTVSYTEASRGITNDVYDDAVLEADRIVATSVDPGAEFGTDLNLQTAATFIAAAIVCRIAAGAALANGASGRDATVWLDLAASFENDGRSLLATFKPPRKNLAPPRQV